MEGAKPGKRRRLEWLGWAGAASLAILAGVLLTALPIGSGLQHLSYDLPFAFRSRVVVTNAAVVYLDRKSLEELQQPTWPPDRKVFADLVTQLRRAGARMILFDVVFRISKPESDAEFGEAIRQHGGVVLGGLFDVTRHQADESVSVSMGQAFPPTPILKTNAAAWGLLTLRPLDYSFAARRIFLGINEIDSLVLAAARKDGAVVTFDPKVYQAEYWLNFYGPSRSLDGVSLFQALSPDGVPPDFFKGKVVVVGADPSLTPQTGERDVFPTPYSRLGFGADAGFMAGVEMLATAYCNLVRGDWLRRMRTGTQVTLVVFWGLLLGVALNWLSPRKSVLLAVGGGLLLAAVSIVLQIHQHIWWAWLVPAGVQTSLALAWTIGFRYVGEARQRQQLRQAFSAYLSPHVAEQVVAQNLDLAPGGQEMEVTIMFTDLEGFTQMSETLKPTELSVILSTYFEKVSQEVLEQDGTIIKYIGDAVLAVWGAPLAAPDQADRAVKTALGISQETHRHVFGHTLRTRVGVNTGVALVGNLGSKLRFDYTVIGANVNYASRLEALNKVFGTSILISETTRQQLRVPTYLRSIGQVLVRGTTQPAPVYELISLGSPDALITPPPWCATFGEALLAYQHKKFDDATRLFQQVTAERNGQDGPSDFYLRQLEKLKKEGLPDRNWDGMIDATKL